jgi:formate dehydrogenase alpha subunit
MVTLTIDGVEVTVERGASILEAAQAAGVEIPTLCHDKRLIPYGACRLCMVEVTARGRTRRMPACFNPARDGMEVATHTPTLIEGRRMQLMLLLRSHPLLCPSCDAAGDCKLQQLVHEYEVPDLPFARQSRFFHVDNKSHFIRFNMNLCIRCGMCVRICDELQGRKELSFINRGIESEVSTDFGRPLDCEFCGQCAQVCPVGAISSKWLVGTGREFELKRTNTTCAFCSLGCTLTFGEKDDKIVVAWSPADSHNEGNLCVKGRYGWPFIHAEERLSKPLIRKNDALQEVDWDEALSFVAEKLSAIKNESGANALAALGSARVTNEEAYVFNRFVRTVLGTSNLDHAGGVGYKSLVDGLGPVFGFPASTNALTELRNAHVTVLVGADLTETHPVAKNEVILASNRLRAQTIVIDPVTTKLTERPGMHLAAKPGTEYAILYAMLKEIIDQDLFDGKALDLKAEGFDELQASLADYSPDNIAGIAGVDAKAIRDAAKEYAEASTAVIILTEGMNKSAEDVLAVKAAAALALVAGKVGKEACGVHVLGEKANSQGAIDMGLAPDMLPGFQKITDPEAREKFEKAWGASLPEGEGAGAKDILSKAASGDIKGLYIVGENPVDTYPDRNQTENALKGLQFLVVQDMFLTPQPRWRMRCCPWRPLQKRRVRLPAPSAWSSCSDRCGSPWSQGPTCRYSWPWPRSWDNRRSHTPAQSRSWMRSHRL